MNKTLLTIALSLISVYNYFISAAVEPPQPPPAPPPPPLPIDGGVFVLLTLAFLYGSYKLFQTKNLQKK